MESQSGETPIRPAERLAAPIVQVELDHELELLRAGNSYLSTDHAATTILKRPGIRVVLMALRAGGQVAEHHQDSPIAVQVLEGHIRFEVGGQTLDLRRGHLLGLADNLPHQLLALEESALLLTIGAVLSSS